MDRNKRNRKRRSVYSAGKRFYESVVWGGLKHTTRLDEGRREDLRTVCLMLGPYRNLTSLTSSLLFLHPNCQVLNHAGGRVLGSSDLDFLSDYSRARFDRFCQFVFFASKGGLRGQHGGSIALSNAFNKGGIRQVYGNRYGENTRLKEKVHCILWKESLRVSNVMRETGVDLNSLLAKNDKLRFLMPVRNPLDCAISNRRTGHAALFPGLDSCALEDILDRVLREYLWFLKLEQKHPERFFHFFQDDLYDRKLYFDIAEFLELAPEEKWIKDVQTCAAVKRSYTYSPEWMEMYEKLINFYFKDYPVFLRQLEKMSLHKCLRNGGR